VPDPLEEILQLVADGRLTAAEAAPIVAALEGSGAAAGIRAAGWTDRSAGGSATDDPSVGSGRSGRTVRLEVRERGRTVVNLRLPASLGESAMLRVPGLAGPQIDRIRSALASGLRGPVLEVGDEDDGVRIVID
jgi:hypothetical protein